EVDIGWSEDALKAGMTYLEHLFGASIAKTLDQHADELTDYARTFAEKGRTSKPADFVWSLEVAGQMYNTLGPILERYNVLVCPTNALPAVRADFDQSRDEVTINGKRVNPMLGWVMTTPFNTMSRCPVITVPSGRAGNGVPTSIQVVGKTYRDADVFRAAAAYEREAGGWFGGVETRPSM
ncbi:MAG: amidase family protein, partial [Aestuariivirgaceae bacterium]